MDQGRVTTRCLCQKPVTKTSRLVRAAEATEEKSNRRFKPVR